MISEAFHDAYILLYREIVTGQTVPDIDFSRRRNAVTQRRSLSLKKRVPVLISLDEGMHISLYSYKFYSTNAQKLRNANN